MAMSHQLLHDRQAETGAWPGSEAHMSLEDGGLGHGPLSATASRMVDSPAVSARMTRSPSPWTRALSTRFAITWRRRAGSAATEGRLSAHRARRARYPVAAFAAAITPSAIARASQGSIRTGTPSRPLPPRPRGRPATTAASSMTVRSRSRGARGCPPIGASPLRRPGRLRWACEARARLPRCPRSQSRQTLDLHPWTGHERPRGAIVAHAPRLPLLGESSAIRANYSSTVIGCRGIAP